MISQLSLNAWCAPLRFVLGRTLRLPSGLEATLGLLKFDGVGDVSGTQTVQVRQGRTVAFSTCVLLVQDLPRAKKELRLSRAIKKLAHYEALVIDDIGYVQQSREEIGKSN